MHHDSVPRWSEEKDASGAVESFRIRKADGKQSIATVPIVFSSHENANYNHRAYLPIIVQDYTEQVDWYSLRVLYLDVTSTTEIVLGEDEEYYVCRLDPKYEDHLECLVSGPPISVFISYNSDDRLIVEPVYTLMSQMKPYVRPFIDSRMTPGDEWVKRLMEAMDKADMWILFLSAKGLGPGQDIEVQELRGRLMGGSASKIRVVPVLLDEQAQLPPLIPRQTVKGQ